MVNCKQNLRKWAKEERKKLDIESLSIKLTEKIKEKEEYIHAKNIMLYYPLKDEINLLSLLEDNTKNFYLPKISNNELLCCPYNKSDKLCESCFRTKEPLTKPVDKAIIDLIVVPALAVDKNNYRLGYGGGFYDRFLKGIKCTKIACIPNELYIESVFPEEHDICVDLVILV